MKRYIKASEIGGDVPVWDKYYRKVSAKFICDNAGIEPEDLCSAADEQLESYGCEHIAWLVPKTEFVDVLDDFGIVELVRDPYGTFICQCSHDRVYDITDEIEETMQSGIESASEIGEDDDLDHPDQEYDSADTSINSSKLPAVYRMINIPKGTVGIDFGGGRFDNAVEHIKDLGATLCVYDPYNRTAEHNREVLRTLRANGGADWAVNSNVLNVIKEGSARKGVLENIKKITKNGAPIYITVYEGRGDGKEGPTKSGYQLNRKTADYLEEIQEVFPDATRKGKLIVAHNGASSVSSATTRNINDDYMIMKSSYKNEQKFKDVDKESSYYRDLIEKLDRDDVPYEEYRNKTDNGFSVFYDGPRVPINCSTKSSDEILKRLESDVKSVAVDVMKDLGFEDSEIDSYLFVETFRPENSQLSGVEVRAELDYNNLVELADELDAVITRYDEDSYFEPEAPGILKAYLDLPRTLPKCPVSKADSTKYSNRQTVTVNKQKYNVLSTDMSMTGDEEEGLYVLKQFRFQVSKIAPYDDASYYYAIGANGQIVYAQDGKVAKRDHYSDPDRLDMSNTEWMDYVLRKAIRSLEDLNRNIESVPVYNSQKITSGRYDIQEPPLDPHDYDEGEELSEEVDYKFSLDDVIITVDDKGYWGYDKPEFILENCESDGLYCDEVDVLIRDQDELLEDLDEVIGINIPEKAGKYKLKGQCNLRYDVDDIVIYTTFYSEDDVEQYIDTDSMTVKLDKKKSYIENLEVEPI